MCNEITELEQHLLPLQRYVRFRIHHPQDAEDIIQEVCLAATKSNPSLPTPEAYKAWLIGIARHSETEEELVVYRALYGDGALWARPLSMWNEWVSYQGKTVLRFTPESE